MQKFTRRLITLLSLFCISFSATGLLQTQQITAYGLENTTNSTDLYSTGFIRAEYTVTPDFSQAIDINNLSLGVQISDEWAQFISNPILQNELIQANFKIVRLFVFQTQPCVNWNETTETGTYNWTSFDQLMQTLDSEKTENILICVGWGYLLNGLPQGMIGNYNSTGFPNPVSFAAYCKDIALHIKNQNWTVKYWEPYNEPISSMDNETSYEGLVNLFNTASYSVLQILPYALFGIDISNYKSFLDRFVYDGRNVGFLSFHKYDSYGTWLSNPQASISDDAMLSQAGTLSTPETYTPLQMENLWESVKGAEIPIICSETNMNSACNNGTDPRMQQPIGAVWYAEELRAFIMNNVQYSVYYCLASNDAPNWEINKQTEGYGFGMTNQTFPNTIWYPYLTNYIIGNNLKVGDKIVNALSSNSTAISTLAWVDNNVRNILLIGKVNKTITVDINTATIDIGSGSVAISEINSKSSTIQTSMSDLSNEIRLSENGYFVALVKLLRKNLISFF